MSRVFTVDRKPVVVFNSNPVPTKNVIRKVYRRIPDSKTVPVMFMTRKQYLELYLKNQERSEGTKFSSNERREYIRQEMPFYRNIIGRYTTRHNPYFPPAVVFFNDKKIPASQFKDTVFHEYGHEFAEKKGLRLWDEERFSDGVARRLNKRRRRR